MTDIPKKRGRTKKEKPETTIPPPPQNNITLVIQEEVKKRGRKPKGGKLVSIQTEPEQKTTSIVNVILHLKCSLNDLEEYNCEINKFMKNELVYNSEIPPEIKTYNIDSEPNFSIYETNNINLLNYAYQDGVKTNTNYICQSCSFEVNNENKEDEQLNMKDINTKLKSLKINLYKNTLQDKKSACFWCTYEYDNQTCYIPKYENDDKIYGYGSFCRPECAVAYLMKENIDDSTKFERYHLLNQTYGKIYDYNKNIKPAPNPYYLLEKYYGSLTIQEYRKLLNTEHLLTVIDKPMTRILPELFEDNDKFVMSVYGNSGKQTSGSTASTTSRFKVKRQSEKKQEISKNSIVRDKFGLV